MREAVKASVPPGTEELNLKAFDQGLEYAARRIEQPAVELHRPPMAEATR